MKRISSSEYISSIKKRKSRARRFNFLVGVVIFFALLTSFILYSLVRTTNVLSIPDRAREYLLNNNFYEFSSTELRNILLNDIGDTSSFLPLLAIYWGFILMMLIFSIGILYFIFGSSSQDIKSTILGDSPRNSLLSINILQVITLRYIRNPTRINRTRLIRAIPGRKFHLSISPIRRKWYKEPQHQWLSIKSFDKESRLILFVLSNLFRAFQRDIDEDKDLSVYLPLLNMLERFFLLILNRTDEDLKIIDLDEDFSEKDILIQFSQDARPIITSALFPHEDVKPKAKFRKYFNRVRNSLAVRGAIIISGIAALVMVLGVLLFQIDIRQAFLTWFTVTFGSLTISIGAASFSQLGKRNQEQSD